MQLRRRRAAAARDSQPQMLFHSTAAVPPRRAGRRRRAERRGTLRGGKAAHLVWRTRDADPLTATDGLETLRGARPWRRQGREYGLHDCKSTPCYFSLSKSHLDMKHKPLKGTMPARVPI